MNNSFLSIVLILDEESDWKQLPGRLQTVYGSLKGQFAHWEIILVNNTDRRQLEGVFDGLEEGLRSGLYLIHLARKTNHHHAALAGFDRANGDYTILLENAFLHERDAEESKDPILALYEKAREGYDIVYFRAPARKARFSQRLLYGLFYHIMRRYSELDIDPLAHDTRIISRRALNALLRLREKLPFMKAIYSLVGYRSTAVDTSVPIDRRKTPLREQIHNSLLSITSYTHFLRAMLLRVFLFAMAFLFLVTANALSVKFIGKDLLGTPQEAVSGWTFLVVLISAFFAMTFLILYIMSIYLSNIYQEIKQRPLYVVEAFQRV